jgi:hypothetical protein
MMRWALAIFLLWPCAVGLAWDGYDYDNSASVEIEKGNLVRSGNDIEFYDYGDGQYHEAEVQDINRSGSQVEVEVYDHESGEHRTLTMEDD